MRIVMFYHSLLSDWNHGNAHFLRGVATEMLERGHDVTVWEPRNAWSLENLRAEYGDAPLEGFRAAYPALARPGVSEQYDPALLDLDEALDGADLVLVHEWNENALVQKIGVHRAIFGGYRLLFHDTDHHAVTDPTRIAEYDLDHYDGVLAFGNVLRDLYLREGWTQRAWTWHEAADVRVFKPLPNNGEIRGDLVWIGNWGDEERAAELREFLFHPVKALGLRARVYGVRYPEAAKRQLAEAGIDYGGWLPNYAAPEVFARYRATVHVPRRPYTQSLPGIPTIRVFETLACGIPLVSAPWQDSENLFTPGEDFLFARNGAEMQSQLRAVLNDAEFAGTLAEHGLATICARHTCAHRVDELEAIYAELIGKSC